MSADTQLVVVSSVLNFLLLLALVKADKKYFIYSLLIFIAYSVFFYNGLFYHGQYGSSLVWLVYLLFINAVHSLMSIAMLIWHFIKKKKS